MATQTENLPSYADLPVKPGAPAGSAWGLFGDDDQLGCLNLLTPERVIAAARLVRKGAVFPLNLSIDRPDPPLFGRGAARVEFVTGEVHRDDYLDNFWPQASSQWDSLRHILHPRDGFYNGVTAAEVTPGGGKLGIENVARRGIAAPPRDRWLPALPPHPAARHGHRRAMVPRRPRRRLRARRRLRVHVHFGTPQHPRRRRFAAQRPRHQVGTGARTVSF